MCALAANDSARSFVWHWHHSTVSTPHSTASFSCVCMQLPDEQEILKRRLKVEERKRNASVALTVLDASSKAARAHSAWAGDAAGGSVEPITLFVKNLRWVVVVQPPFAAFSAASGDACAGPFWQAESFRHVSVFEAFESKKALTVSLPLCLVQQILCTQPLSSWQETQPQQAQRHSLLWWREQCRAACRQHTSRHRPRAASRQR